MNSGIENLIGSVSYELASDEACQTKAQHEAGPSPSKPSATTTRQAYDQAQRKSQAQPKLGRARGQGCDSGPCAVRSAWAARPACGRAVLVRHSCVLLGILRLPGFVI